MSIHFNLNDFFPDPNQSLFTWGNTEEDLPQAPLLSQIPSLTPVQAESEIKVELLENFLYQSLQNLLLSKVNLETFKSEIQKFLEPCTSILTPSNQLQFLRQLATRLISGQTQFECLFDNQRERLTIPFNFCCVPEFPVTITIPNPGLLILLGSLFNPTFQGQEYIDLTTKIVKSLIFQLKEECPEEVFEIVFEQLNNQYVYQIKLRQILLLFFPINLTDEIKSNPQYSYDKILKSIYSLFNVRYSDLRLEEQIEHKQLILENLIFSDHLYDLMPFLKKDESCFRGVFRYLCHLLEYGIVKAEPILHPYYRILIFKIADFIINENVQKPIIRFLSFLLLDALRAIKMSQKSIEPEILQLPCLRNLIGYQASMSPIDYEDYKNNRGKVLEQKQHSFLLSDLSGTASYCTKAVLESTKTQTIPSGTAALNEFLSKLAQLFSGSLNEARCSNIVPSLYILGAALLKQWEHSKGIQLIISSEHEHFHLSTHIEKTVFIEGLFQAWRHAISRYSPLEAKNSYVTQLTYFIELSRCELNPNVMKNYFGVFLALVPFLDRNLLFSDPKFQNILLHDVEKYALQSISDFSVHLIKPEKRGRVITHLREGIHATKPFLGDKRNSMCVIFNSILDELLVHCKNNSPYQVFQGTFLKFIDLCSKQTPPSAHINFAKFLFTGYLASLRFESFPFNSYLAIPPIYKEMLYFQHTQIKNPQTVPELISAIGSYNRNAPKNILIFTTMHMLQQLNFPPYTLPITSSYLYLVDNTSSEVINSWTSRVNAFSAVKPNKMIITKQNNDTVLTSLRD